MTKDKDFYQYANTHLRDQLKSTQDIAEKNKTLRTRIDKLESKLEYADKLSRNPFILSSSEIDYLKSYGLKHPIDDLKSDLIKNYKLIPFKGVVGGLMGFHPKSIWILNHKWVFAQFEDGHIGGKMLLSFSLSEDGKINWKVLESYKE